MVKLQDPTTAFADIVPARRSMRAAAIGERFRLGVERLECGTPDVAVDRTAVIGASAWALKDEHVEDTVETIGSVGGLLADLGFGVCPISAVTIRAARSSLVIWVCGNETRADEYHQLADIGLPGISLGSCVDDLNEWGYLDEPLGAAFTRKFVALVERIACPGNTPPDSELLADFLAEDAGQGGIGGDRTGSTEPQDPRNHRRRGAGRDEPGRGATAS